MNKYGLVLEGGGMRGAYTAGCLKWLLEKGIEFQTASAISATAVFNAYYLTGDKAALEKLGTELMSDKNNVGIIPILTELQILGYRHMFGKLLKKEVPLDFDKLRASSTLMQFGVYSKEEQKLHWIDNHSIDQDLKYLRASCVLPVACRAVKVGKQHFMDGGIETMMPIFHAQDIGNDRFFCVTTKHSSYVRTPNGKFLSFVIKWMYHRYPKLLASIDDRVNIYYREMGTIEDLVKENKAILMRPSRLINVSRLKATKDDLVELFNLGYSDCEDRKAEIMAFFGKK